MKNWKTSIGGLISAAIAVLIIIQKLMNGESVQLAEIMTLGAAVGGAVTGLAAKDHNVTGGTVSQPSPTNPPPSAVLKNAIEDAQRSEKDLGR